MKVDELNGCKVDLEFHDPRSEKPFDHSLFPHVEGIPVPGASPEAVLDYARLAFSSAYYDLNLAMNSLDQEPNCIERSLRRIDGLNEVFFPFGIYCAPVILKGRVRALQIMYPPGSDHSSPAPSQIKSGIRLN